MNEIDPQVETNDIIAEVMKIPLDQRVQFRLIQLIGNTQMKFSGAKIVRDLLNNYNRLWKSCLVGSSEECSIILLKDLPYRFQRNIDTLYIMPLENKQEILKELEKLAESWRPDELKWVPKSKVKTLIDIECPALKLYWKIPISKEISVFSLEEAKERVAKAKVDLQNRHPWFGWLAQYLNIKEKRKESISTMCINEHGNLLYSPEFIKNREINEIKGIICHEILHLALQHPFIANNKHNLILYNLAADLKINSIIRKTKSLSDLKLKNAFMALELEEREGDIFWLDPVIINNISKKTTDQIYYELKKELPFKFWKNKKNNGEVKFNIDTSRLPKKWKRFIDRMIKEVSLDKDDIKPAEVKKLSQEWWIRVNKANQQFSKDIPAGLSEELLTLKRKKIS